MGGGLFIFFIQRSETVAISILFVIDFSQPKWDTRLLDFKFLHMIQVIIEVKFSDVRLLSTFEVSLFWNKELLNLFVVIRFYHSLVF
jgi:hypothetical protein